MVFSDATEAHLLAKEIGALVGFVPNQCINTGLVNRRQGWGWCHPQSL